MKSFAHSTPESYKSLMIPIYKPMIKTSENSPRDDHISRNQAQKREVISKVARKKVLKHLVTGMAKRKKCNFTTPVTTVGLGETSIGKKSFVNLKTSIQQFPKEHSQNDSRFKKPEAGKRYAADTKKREKIRMMLKNAVGQKSYINLNQFGYQVSNSMSPKQLQNVNLKFEK
mmetsp:Transcript_41678/g.48110  ORF Transcript_41678/g.48110 Transcript_41678/m.48110 type:complete len:172 (-) Transcript_41678:88-603(-)